MGDKADELAGIAVELVTRVRDDDPEAVHRWLTSVVDPADWMGLAVVLACAVPDDKSWEQLTEWTHPPEPETGRQLRPHGTPAALRRHQANKERVCDACKAYDARRKRDERAARQRSVDGNHTGQVKPVDEGTSSRPQPVDNLPTQDRAGSGRAA